MVVTEKPVLVTGANGFIASHIVKILLEKGYKVKGTVRKVEDSKVKHLKALDPSGENLQLLAANLVDEGSFDEACQGCEYVIHCASPYSLNVADPQKELVDPALKGTLTVFDSCTKAGTVKRVILTSSMASVTDEPIEGHVYTEADWNTKSSLSRNPYYYSKVLAEKAAWKFVEELPQEKKFELVTINPWMVVGPALGNESVNQTNQVLVDLVSGKYPGLLSLGWSFVDVRDVALSHILAMENEKAEGRYIIANEAYWMTNIVERLSKIFPDFKYPTLNLANGFGNGLVYLSSYFRGSGVGEYLRTHIGVLPSLDNSKSKGEKLGLEYRSLDDTFRDTIQDFIDQKIVSPPKKCGST